MVPQSLIQKSWKLLGTNTSVTELEPAQILDILHSQYGQKLCKNRPHEWMKIHLLMKHCLMMTIDGIEEKDEESFENDIFLEMDQTVEAPDLIKMKFRQNKLLI
jgi:hypothetical protein